MKDALKDFIVSNREGFDDLVPGDLWAKIDLGLKQQNSLFNPKHITNMLKYGFGASALVAGTFLLVNTQKEKVQVLNAESRTVIDSPLPTFKTPKLNAGAILLTEIKQEKEEEQSLKSDSAEIGESSFAAEVQDTVREARHTFAASAMFSYSPPEVPKDSIPSSYAVIDTLFNGIRRIEVKLEFCDVNVKAVKGNQVAMHGRISDAAGAYLILGRKAYKKTEYEFKIEKQDSVLRIWMEHIKVNEKMHSKDISEERSVISLDVPAKTGLDVSTSSGNLVVNGLENKHMQLKTTFGNIHAENISSDLILKSSSGNITLARITGEIKMDNSFGNQSLDDIKGNIKLRSSSGNLTVKQLTGNAEASTSFGNQKFENVTGNIVSNVSSGKLSIKHLKGNINSRSSFGSQTFENIEGDLNSKTSSGDINISDLKGMLSLGTSFGDIRGKNITLVSNSDFKTSSGDISMHFLNDMKELSFDLTSSSGDLLVDKGNVKNVSDKKLVFGQGAILVKGVSSFGDQTCR